MGDLHHQVGLHRDRVIVRSTVDLGHNLGLQVVAEGVEDQATWQELDALGCDSVQGYHLARPMPADELTGWIRAQSKPTASSLIPAEI